MAGLAEPVNSSMFPSRDAGSSATNDVLKVRFCSGYPNPNRNIIRKGPKTSVRISRGWRMISVSSLLMNEEIRIRNLNSLRIGGLLFDQFYKYIVKRRSNFFNCFYVYSFSLARL